MSAPGGGCQDDFDTQSITPDQARERIRAAVRPLAETETVPLAAALDRVLARDAPAAIDVPGAANSAMDGYAVRGEDLPAAAEAALELIGEAYAGRPFAGAVGPGQCARIMTGAVMPDGADTVVVQERTWARDDGRIGIGAGERPGQNVRAAGEDIAAGSVLLPRGRRLGPAELGLLASVGAAEIEVVRRPRVAFFATGDELRAVGEALAPGALYNSNSHTLGAMLRRVGVAGEDLGIVRDERAATAAAFRAAAARADVVLTSGGVSVGAADYVRDALEELGEVRFWKVAVKPGRPLAFGRLGGAWFFGLPGNPVSVMVTFCQFVRPALLRIAGEADPPPPLELRATALAPLRKRPGRVEYQRGILRPDGSGALGVAPAGAQGSGILSSMSRANCFIVLPLDGGRVDAGAAVTVVPFAGLL